MKLPSGIEMKRIVVIGLGGIGSWVALAAARMFKVPFLLIDPDVITPANLGRQLFNSAAGYKVDAFANTVKSITGQVTDARALFISPNNVFDFIRDGDVVFVCPDNHAARRCVADAASDLHSIVVFTAGNEVYQGNCHAFVKMDRVSLTRHLRTCHPDVFVDQQAPAQGMSCNNLIDHGNYQVLVTNMATASIALNMFFLMSNCHAPLGTGKVTSQWPEDGWVDILTGNQRIVLADSTVVVPPIVRTDVLGMAAC